LTWITKAYQVLMIIKKDMGITVTFVLSSIKINSTLCKFTMQMNIIFESFLCSLTFIIRLVRCAHFSSKKD